MNLSEVVAKIKAYNDVATKHAYKDNNETGSAPWSIKLTHANGYYIELRGSEWTLYAKDDTMIATGTTPDELFTCLTTLIP